MFRSVKHWLWLLLCWFVLAGQVWAMPCDVDTTATSTATTSPSSRNPFSPVPRSPARTIRATPTSNSRINSIDGRLCALRCTRAKCSTINQPPFANAGPDQTVKVGDPVQLSGAASSDPDGDPLRYTVDVQKPSARQPRQPDRRRHRRAALHRRQTRPVPHPAHRQRRQTRQRSRHRHRQHREQPPDRQRRPRPERPRRHPRHAQRRRLDRRRRRPAHLHLAARQRTRRAAAPRSATPTPSIPRC
jgi:hypothetical protein